MDKHQKQTEINKYEKFMHWLWRQKSITELVLNIGMDGIAKKYVKERVSADSSHDAPAALPLQNVSNLIFTGIGYCGMSKDVEVRGRLTEVRKEHSHATITDEKGQPHAVNLKTVKICC